MIAIKFKQYTIHFPFYVRLIMFFGLLFDVISGISPTWLKFKDACILPMKIEGIVELARILRDQPLEHHGYN